MNLLFLIMVGMAISQMVSDKKVDRNGKGEWARMMGQNTQPTAPVQPAPDRHPPAPAIPDNGDRAEDEVVQANQGKYFRSAPYTDGPLSDVAALLCADPRCGLLRQVTAYLLKWLAEGRIQGTLLEGCPVPEGMYGLMKDTDPPAGDPAEERLWNLLFSQVPADGALQEDWPQNGAEGWAADILSAWWDGVRQDSTDALLQKGYLMGDGLHEVMHLSPKGELLRDHMAQHRNFLLDLPQVYSGVTPDALQLTDWLQWSALLDAERELRRHLLRLWPDFTDQLAFSKDDHISYLRFREGFQRLLR